MSDNAVIILLVAVFFFLLLCLPGGGAPPAPKDDPDKDEQRSLALKMLKGEKTPEDIAAQEGYDIEHIKQWKADYLDAAEKDHNLRKKLDID